MSDTAPMREEMFIPKMLTANQSPTKRQRLSFQIKVF